MKHAIAFILFVPLFIYWMNETGFTTALQP